MSYFKRIYSSRNEDGFTLAELTVGIMVGVIVFSMAIAFLVSFATASYRANAKSDITNSSRIAISSILKEVSSASSNPGCVQWKNKNAAGNTSQHSNLDFKKANCIQLVNSSESLAVAADNALCWYKTTEDSDDTSIVIPDKVSCLYRGDANADALCKTLSFTDPDTLYLSTCQRSTLSRKPTSSRIIANLGPHSAPGTPSGNLPERKKLFTYIQYDSNILPSNGTTEKILKVNIKVEVSYENGNYKNGLKDYSIYRFSSTIQLSNMRAYLEAGAYGS